MSMKHWINKNYKTLIITAFLIPIIVVAIVSISHVTKWYGISNPVSWAIYLSVGIEIAALSAIAAISANMGNKIYLPFIVVTLIQFIGNIYFSYNYIDINSDSFKSWVDLSSPVVGLFGVESTDFIGHKRVLALFAGGLLPVISLSFLHFLVKFAEENRMLESKNVSKQPTTELETPKTNKTTIVEPIEEVKVIESSNEPEIISETEVIEQIIKNTENTIPGPIIEPEVEVIKIEQITEDVKENVVILAENMEKNVPDLENSNFESEIVPQVEINKSEQVIDNSEKNDVIPVQNMEKNVPDLENIDLEPENAVNNIVIAAENTANIEVKDEVLPVGPKREEFPFHGDGAPIEIFDVDMNKKKLNPEQKNINEVNPQITNKANVITTPVVTPTIRPELDPEYIRKNNQIKTFWRNVKNSKRVINK